MSSISALPPELLLEIFRYLPQDELLDNVQNVCTAWGELVRDPSLWEDFVYSPETSLSIDEVISFVGKCPMLKHIHVYIGLYKRTAVPEEYFPRTEELVSTVIKNCCNIRSFCVEFGIGFLTISQIDALFEAFPNLEFFKIKINYENAIETVDRISRCKNLKKLIVKSNENCGAWLKPIVDGCISLEYLRFWCPKIPEENYLYILENMKDRLTYLRFNFDQLVTQQAVNLYSSFSKLEYLNLYHYREQGRVNFLPLANIRTLKWLVFYSNTSLINDVETIFDILFHSLFPLLQKLSLKIGNCDWGRTVLKDICLHYPKLKCLHLRCQHLGDVRDTFEEICRLVWLESLVCRDSVSITDEDTEYISRCPRLKHLDLCNCVVLTDKTIVHLVNCQSLEYLNLCHCSISGQSLHLIPEHLNRLKKLDLFGTKVDLKVVHEIVKKMPLLDVCF